MKDLELFEVEKKNQTEILFEIQFERDRQDEKWGDQSGNRDDTWVAILTEEVGEAAKEVLETGALNGNLRKELIQCAAVCVAWIEALDKRGE